MKIGDIASMAQQAGFGVAAEVTGNYEIIERFAALVAAHEREECAKIVQNNADLCQNNGMLHIVLESNAHAIRARGKQ